MFSPATLNMLPTGALASVSDSMTMKAEDEAAALSAEKARKDRMEGNVETESFVNGKTVKKLSNTAKGITKVAGLAAGALAAGSLAKTLLDGGKEPFAEGSLAEGTIADAETVGQMNAELDSQLRQADPDVSLSLQLETAASNARISEMQASLNNTLDTLNQVNDVIAKRASGELPNPSLNVSLVGEALDAFIEELEASGAFTEEQIAAFRSQLDNAASRSLDNFEKYVINNISQPYSENRAALDIIKARLLDDQDVDEDAPIFDTVFGPPVSTEGKFLLSEDGIYYDSRTGSIPYITARAIDSVSWQLRYESNRGGRGQEYTQDSTQRFADTILSDAYENETPKVLDFYKYDDVLVNLRNDRDLQVRDVKGKVEDLIASGYDSSSAIVKNYEESYASVAYTYDRKIKRRKKQLQIAALFGPFGVTPAGDPRGEGLFFREYQKQQASLVETLCGSDIKVQQVTFSAGPETSSIEFIPRIPVNDFSYLKEIGLIPELESQKQAMLHSSDLDDTTAPIVPVFLEQGPGAKYEAIPEISLPPYGTADWVNTSGDTGASAVASATVSGVAPYLRTLDDAIVTDSLVVCYNFLESKAPTTPDSNEYSVKNYVDNGYPLNAKMVGLASSIFVSGLSIPYLTGSLYRPGDKYGIRYSYLPYGSYVRLPNNYRNNNPYPASQSLDNLMYNPQGWSMDFWVYAPDLYDGMTTDHRYKLVAANENCGDPTTNSFATTIFTAANMDGEQGVPRKYRTKGMLVGFRDKGDPGTDLSAGLEFVVLPTVAQNDPQWGKSVTIGESVSGEGSSEACRTELGFKVPASATTESGYSIADASAAFTHYNVVCDVATDSISLFVNGEFLLSATTSTSFDTKPGIPLQIPSRIREGHYHEKNGMFGEKLYDGALPEIPIFTPWILGGGFTDGVTDSPFTQTGATPETTLPGFLGTNTNTSYFSATANDASGGPVGQHSVISTGTAGLGGYEKTGTNYLLARSGLDGHLGSFKMYSKPLSKLEVEKNYKAQSPFFNGIARPYHLL